MTITEDDFWRPFGEAKWRDLAQTVSASELQLKFAVARFNGASASAAAKIAGYAADDHDDLRRAGYSAVRSTAVQNLIELAEINAPAAAGLSEAEVDAKVAKLVRSPDPSANKAGIELYEKRKAARKEAGEAPEDDGFTEWRHCRDRLLYDGACSFMLGYKRRNGDLGCPNNFPLLHDVKAMADREPHGPEVWAWVCQGLSVTMRNDLDVKLANPDYQREARQKIWAERGIKIGTNGEGELMPGGFIA